MPRATNISREQSLPISSPAASRMARPKSSRTVTAAPREDERNVRPAQAKIGQRALVDGIELGGDALAAAPGHEPVDQRPRRPRDDGGQKPPHANQCGAERRIARHPGTTQRLIAIWTG